MTTEITLQDKLQEELKSYKNAYEFYTALAPEGDDWKYTILGYKKMMDRIELALEQNIELTWEQYQLLDKIFRYNTELLNKRV